MPTLSIGASEIYGEAAFEVLAKAQELERKGRTILHFEIGEPDMETPDHIKKAGIHAINENKTHYVPSIGILELRQVVVDEIEQTRGYRPDLEQIVITPGLKPGIFFAMLAATFKAYNAWSEKSVGTSIVFMIIYLLNCQHPSISIDRYYCEVMTYAIS